MKAFHSENVYQTNVDASQQAHWTCTVIHSCTYIPSSVYGIKAFP